MADTPPDNRSFEERLNTAGLPVDMDEVCEIVTSIYEWPGVVAALRTPPPRTQKTRCSICLSSLLIAGIDFEGYLRIVDVQQVPLVLPCDHMVHRNCLVTLRNTPTGDLNWEAQRAIEASPIECPMEGASLNLPDCGHWVRGIPAPLFVGEDHLVVPPLPTADNPLRSCVSCRRHGLTGPATQLPERHPAHIELGGTVTWEDFDSARVLNRCPYILAYGGDIYLLSPPHSPVVAPATLPEAANTAEDVLEITSADIMVTDEDESTELVHAASSSVLDGLPPLPVLTTMEERKLIRIGIGRFLVLSMGRYIVMDQDAYVLEDMLFPVPRQTPPSPAGSDASAGSAASSVPSTVVSQTFAEQSDKSSSNSTASTDSYQTDPTSGTDAERNEDSDAELEEELEMDDAGMMSDDESPESLGVTISSDEGASAEGASSPEDDIGLTGDELSSPEDSGRDSGDEHASTASDSPGSMDGDTSTVDGGASPVGDGLTDHEMEWLGVGSAWAHIAAELTDDEQEQEQLMM